MSKTISTASTKSVSLNDSLYNQIVSLVSRRGLWSGSMTELNAALVRAMRSHVPASWPKTPSLLRLAVNRVVNKLRRTGGIKVTFTRTPDHDRKRVVTFARRSA